MSQKTHILHVTYDMNIGGTEQVIRNLVEGLDKDKYLSSILCIDGHIGPWGQELQSAGIQHFCLTRHPGFDKQLIKDIRQLINKENIDIVHCHQYTPYTYGWFGSLFTGKPLIFTEHGRFYPDISSFKRKLINPILQTLTSAITSISQATKDALINYENLSESKIEVIYNGIADTTVEPSEQLKKELAIATDDIVLGTISRLDTIKNHPMMLNAFAAIVEKNSHIKLLIVGDGPIKNELYELVEQLNISKQVIFTGFKPNPQAYLSIMDIFLLPSLSEGTSMTLLEAMSFSKPSIATAVGGTPEILIHEETGLLVDNKDEDGLISAINRLINEPNLQIQYGKNARTRYEKHFTLESMTSHYEELYTRIL